MDTPNSADQTVERETTHRPTLARREVLRRAGIGAGMLALGLVAQTALFASAAPPPRWQRLQLHDLGHLAGHRRRRHAHLPRGPVLLGTRRARAYGGHHQAGGVLQPAMPD